jgi:hypothetical protein
MPIPVVPGAADRPQETLFAGLVPARPANSVSLKRLGLFDGVFNKNFQNIIPFWAINKN